MIRVFLVDDSKVMRSQVTSALAQCSDIEIVGVAANGSEALSALPSAQPDVAIIDLEMPDMNGLELLEAMRRLNLKTRTILFASHKQSSALSSLKALNRGAFDFVIKPGTQMKDSDDSFKGLSVAERILMALLPKVRAAAGPAYIQATSPLTPSVEAKKDLLKFPMEALVIGCSTGGPQALEKIFSGLSPNVRCPIFIVQHMPALFTAALADRLNRISGLPVHEAKHLEDARGGHVYVAPGDFHMRLAKNADRVQIKLDQGPQWRSVRPAVDHLFSSASAIYTQKLLGVVLTGMGEDGRLGCEVIKSNGGAVMIQDENSSIVYGMPRAVRESGAYDMVVSLEAMSGVLRPLLIAEKNKLGMVP